MRTRNILPNVLTTGNTIHRADKHEIRQEPQTKMRRIKKSGVGDMPSRKTDYKVIPIGKAENLTVRTDNPTEGTKDLVAGFSRQLNGHSYTSNLGKGTFRENRQTPEKP